MIQLAISNAREGNENTVDVLINIINRNKLSKFYDWYQELLKKDYFYSQNDISISFRSTVLNAIIETSNKQYSNIIVDHLTNIYKTNVRILETAIRGVELFKIPNQRESLIKIFDEYNNENIKQSALLAIASYNNSEDVEFFKEKALSSNELSIIRWISTLSLKYFPDSILAYEALRELSDHPDHRIRARAVYALSYQNNNKVEIQKILIRATKDNSTTLRYYAVLGLENHDSEVVKNILDYRQKYDQDARIRSVAKKILEKKN